MGIFTKPTTTDISLILPFIQNPPDSLVWEITDSTNGVDTVSVQAYDNNDLADFYDDFLTAAATPKVLRYASEYDYDTFTHLDYGRGLDIRLAPKRTFTNGVLTHVDYYASATLDQTGQEVFSDHVVSEQYDYTRNADGFAMARTLTIKWITEAETEHETVKTRFKTYNLTESIRETDRRRSNILDTLKSQMIGIMVAGMGMSVDQAVQTGQSFFEFHMNGIIAFKEIGEVQALIDAINADTTHPWLEAVIAPPTTTMRQYVTSTLAGAILAGS